MSLFEKSILYQRIQAGFSDRCAVTVWKFSVKCNPSLLQWEVWKNMDLIHRGHQGYVIPGASFASQVALQPWGSLTWLSPPWATCKCPLLERVWPGRQSAVFCAALPAQDQVIPAYPK